MRITIEIICLPLFAVKICCYINIYVSFTAHNNAPFSLIVTFWHYASENNLIRALKLHHHIQVTPILAVLWQFFYFHIWILQNSTVHGNTHTLSFRLPAFLFSSKDLQVLLTRKCTHLSVPRCKQVRISSSGSRRFSLHSCWQWSPGGLCFLILPQPLRDFFNISLFHAYLLVCLLSCPHPLLPHLHSIPLFLSQTADAVVIMWKK